MTFFLYHRRSRPTGQVIAQALGLDHGESIPPTTRTPVSLIRWGSRVSFSQTHERAARSINTIPAITTASDKLLSLQRMKDAGVRVPVFSTNPEEMTFPFLGRKTHHARATDVTLCLQRRDYTRTPRDYYVAYVPTVREYRVHAAFGEVIRVQGKFQEPGRRDGYMPHVRNHEYGFVFKTPRKKIKSERTNMAIAAVASLGLDFGAVDLLVGDDDLTYVLEVNTSPSCSPMTAAAYASAFQRELNLPAVDYELLGLLLSDADRTDGDTEDEVPGEED